MRSIARIPDENQVSTLVGSVKNFRFGSYLL